MDVMMVNGTVYPYLEVEPKAYRFRILNGCNGRFLNLQLYKADTGGGSGATAAAALAGTSVQSIAVTNGGSGYDLYPVSPSWVLAVPALPPRLRYRLAL